MSIKTVIFDLDGVVTSTDEFHFLAWQKLFQESRIKFTKKDNEKIRGLSRKESFIAIAGDKFTKKEIEEYTLRKNGYYLRFLKDARGLKAFPGIPELLEKLKKKEIKTVLASASKNARTVLNKLRLEYAFDAVVDGNELTRSKPDPRIFLLAAKKVDANPSECVVLEDAVAGIYAAKAAGMYSIGIGNKDLLSMADVVIPTSMELSIELICSLNLRKCVELKHR